ncbi:MULTISPECIES: efflux RND transporter permease subunit [Dickeya]|uniref:efflux RND transporter permease subunit n=1 Tax=Dickeya TaxID=204037 RepID=UPI00039BA47F|nr:MULTISPECIES: efflux RND transporter permease subunit [Dickeya]UGA51996.1 efflux RND transporter permease subunit [Dickeya fangzhongdai]UWH08340.1 efflux RND transporter permease subunit [Dickeya fangzhongdai]
MKKFNLSEWALQHSALVWYFMIVFSIVGVVAYNQLGREEDPSFTIKTMIIQSQWPGASAEEMTQQVTDRIEKKLQELDNLEHTRSVTTAGKTTIFVDLKAETKAKEVKPTWLRIRNMIADIQHDFPTGVVGPFFNDNFGDVYGNIFAFSSEDMNHRQLRDLVENVRSQILTLPDTGKVDIIGAQDEVIYLEFSTRKIAALGIDKSDILATLQAQNAVTQSGFIQTNGERIALRVGGRFISEDSLRAINLQVNHRFFPLTDVATISRGYIDPPDSLFRFNGKPAIGLIVGMKTGRNLLEFGKELDAMLSKITQSLPVGVTIDRVADQPETVNKAISGFTHALFEAVAIVLTISFISLGIRAGLVVAISIPLVLAITFVIMQYADITLQRVSLGALIIALGLLVDDAMIAVEMMVARLEAGDNLRKAATYVYTSTAFPMLTGTLVTVSGFIPIGFNSSNAGEFTFTLFVVLAVSLIVSWGVAVLFTPLLGVTLLKNMPHHHVEDKGRFMRTFSRIVNYCLKYRWATIATTLATFLLSIVGLAFVQQQFFPNSDRPELIIDWNLPQNSSITETSRQMLKFEKEKLAENKDIDHWSTYVGRSAPRFILSFNVQPDNAFWGQTIIVANDIEARDRLRVDLQQYLKNTFPGTDAYVSLLDIGPPVGKPVQYRISGPDIQTVRNYSRQLASIITSHPSLTNIAFDWNEPARVVKVNVLQDKLRQLGVSSESIATALNGVVEGTSVTQVLDDIYLVDVISRAEKAERGSIESIYNLQLPSSNGKSIPLSSVATFQYKLEQPVIWRWDRIPTVTIKAAINDKKQAATITKELSDKVAAFQQTLPPGYSVTVGGSVEESAKSQAPIARVVPIMLFVMATLLMIQLQGFSKLFLVFSVAPLALIGVVIALLLSNTPLGFVALLGVLALTGILIRNSVILLVLIEELRRTGMSPWQAVVEATEHRIRPILLTAAAATLGLIPISREIFWGPMSFAMMGGIIVGTVLTLLFLPALYVTWFRIKHDA